MRLATLAGSYVAVVLSAQIGAQKFSFEGRLVGKIAPSVVSRIPLVVRGRRFLPANKRDMVTA